MLRNKSPDKFLWAFILILKMYTETPIGTACSLKTFVQSLQLYVLFIRFELIIILKLRQYQFVELFRDTT